MDRRGIPQIFAGYAVHFNGVIPRTIAHPSHSVEWRMAERHGAVCMTKFDPKRVNLLLYRPGYERSEKCRVCVERYIHINAVPITWLLDSLLQSRQIHPSLYRLNSIPAVAQATVRGSDLPHHQHPYYQINKDDYAIPTSFPQKRAGATAVVRSGKAGAVPTEMGEMLPPFFAVEPLQYTNVDIYEATIACVAGKNKEGGGAEDMEDEVEQRRKTGGVELLLAQQALSRVDKMLFSGIVFVLSPALCAKASIAETLEKCGATVLKAEGNVEALLRTKATHVLYAHEDKKCSLMLIAAHLVSTDLPGLKLAQSNWVEDSLMLGEVPPLYGMYVPTPKLMETLNRKHSKKA
ncbi:hypothetical protein STCU_03996 [Strigomonas culicis]|nr:hypothetical protein STCU_03996 [Strigomonas culicis]|eukprot:EPY30579.1 hypothetical protein STCU_03996 [Strigomonas culicis]